MRKIAIITTTRAEYGVLKPVIKAIEDCKELELQLIVSGTHLSKKFGKTIQEIKKDGFNITKEVPILIEEESKLRIIQTISNAILNLGKVFNEIKPDFVLILGDRYEALATTIAATNLNIPIAHFHGGDITEGGLDEPTRHSISNFANIHFVCTQRSAKILKKMGEEEFRIHIVGPLGTALMDKNLLPSKQDIKEKLEIDLEKPSILFVQHPVTTNLENVEKEFTATLEALKEIGMQTIILYPNADAGGLKAISIIEKYKNTNNFFVFKNIDYPLFQSLMKYSKVMVGNSSAALIEAPFFKLPAVNIGYRQRNRERTSNLIDCESEKNVIITAIRKAISKEFIKSLDKMHNPYDIGKNPLKMVVDTLVNTEINTKLIQKRKNFENV